MTSELWLLAGLVGVAAVAGAGLAAWLRRRRRLRREAAAIAWGQALEAERRQLRAAAAGGDLPALDAYENDYRAQNGEKLLAWQEPVDRMEAAPGQVLARVSGVPRCRVVPEGLSARKGLTPQSHGRLLLTDRAIVYENQRRDERLSWSQVTGAELMPDGCVLILRGGGSQIYRADPADPRFAAVLEYMLTRER